MTFAESVRGGATSAPDERRAVHAPGVSHASPGPAHPMTSPSGDGPARSSTVAGPVAPDRQPPDARATLIEEANALRTRLSVKDFLDLCATCFDGQRTGAAMASAPIAQVEAFVAELRKKLAAA